MIALDTNILVYAHRRDAPLHERAQRVVASLATDRQPWAIPWPCVHEFLAIATHPRIWRPPTDPARAVAQVRAWLEAPSCRTLGEPHDHLTRLSTLLERGLVVGPMVHDARVAAICVGHGAELWTSDRDFSRFPALRTRNPLAE